jgi:hypothetical protein
VKQIENIFWIFLLTIKGRLTVYQSFSQINSKNNSFGFKIYTCPVLQSFQNYFSAPPAIELSKVKCKFFYDEGS